MAGPARIPGIYQVYRYREQQYCCCAAWCRKSGRTFVHHFVKAARLTKLLSLRDSSFTSSGVLSSSQCPNQRSAPCRMLRFPYSLRPLFLSFLLFFVFNVNYVRFVLPGIFPLSNGRTLGLFDRPRDAVAWKDSRLIAPLIKYPLANQSA